MDRHVVFIHGLRRVGHKIWMSSGQPPELWPLWLNRDIEKLGVWCAEYDSAPTKWRGNSMARADRANNILALLLSEERLKVGDIAFVTHSFGGLVFEHVLRVANERAPADAKIADFVRRISRVTFLGTPHRGADLATWGGRLRLLARPSLAALGLERNDPDLRDLNQFYRTFATQNGIDTQCLTEARPVRILGRVVKEDSADVGLPVAPIPIDADHFGIASPTSRTSEVYIHVRDQLKKPVRARKTLIQDPAMLDGIAKDTRDSAATLERIEQRLSATTPSEQKAQVPGFLVDAETGARVSRLRRMRFFVGSTHLEEATRLAHSLLHGELSATSPVDKACTLAWCARMLLAKPDRAEALSVLDAARKLARTDEVSIAEAFAASYEGKTSEALNMLAKINSDEARAASFIVVANAKDKPDALDWLQKAGWSASNIAPDGNFFVITKQLEAARWSDALAWANTLTDADYDQTPVLLYMAASAHLLQAVPEELRSLVLWHLPFDAAPLPLADDAGSLTERRIAKDLYTRAAATAHSLGCLRASFEASDRALWLGLRDGSSRVKAHAELERSMRDPTHSLRRLPLALQFGLKLDLQAVEREIDRQDTLSDGNSPDVALARFSIALTKRNPREVADYIGKHRDRLLKHLNPAYVASVEIQTLAQSGQVELAETRLRALPVADQSDHERNRLVRIVAEAKGANPIEAREAQFKNSDALADLANLIEQLEDLKDWQRLVVYGQTFFERTHGLPGCRAYAQALYETADFAGVVDLLDKHPDLLEQSTFLQSIRAWSLFKVGNVVGCRDSLDLLRAKRDDPNDRTLFINLSFASGDWTSLGALVELEWQKRLDRTAEELLRAGQLAQHLGSGRAKDLILEAAAKAGDDAAILIGCYSTAMSAGWEDEQTTKWLERAAALSGEDGPVKKVSLRDILDLHPDWQQRESRTSDQLRAGELPIFAAGHLVNRTLFELFLIPAIANRETIDPRRRTVIYAYSGARRFFQGAARSAAFDPTALLTLGVLEAIDRAFAHFERIVIPHSTLGWLFEERQRIQFHQPSKVVEAREIKRLLENKLLQKLEPSATADNELALEIGDELAALFAEAEADFGVDRRQRLVVRSSPLHRVGSLMEEEVDLAEHAKSVCSCLDVVIALARQGQLTQAEEQRARSYLALREKPWPTSATISPGAILYLDDLSVTYLQHLRLLGKLNPAGFTAIVPPGEVTQGEGFVRYEDLSARATAIIEDIRRTLSEGILSGKVVLAPSSEGRLEKRGRLLHHPSFEIIEAAALADVVVIDDRHFNQHGHIQGEFGARPVWTTYDVLTFSSDDPAQLQEFITHMRRSGMSYVPLKVEELVDLVGKAAVAGGVLVETAELKAVRESLQLARMSNGLQWPKERVWLDYQIMAFLEAIKAQWQDGADETNARARSNWLLEQFDIRQWSHRFTTEEQPDVGRERYRGQVLSLAMLNRPNTDKIKKSYWQWFEEMILEPIRSEDKELYVAIVDQVRAIISEAAEIDGKDGNDVE